MTVAATKPSGFARRIESLSQGVRYRRASTTAEHDALGRLRYVANLREGTIGPDPSETLRDAFDEADACFNMGIYLDDRLVGTLRVVSVGPDFPRSVLAGAYPDIINPLIEKGTRIADVSRLAIDFDASRNYPGLAYIAMRLVFMAADHIRADHIMAGVRREHIPFYMREFRATALTEPRPYPTLVKPLVLFDVDWPTRRPQVMAHRPFYDSTQAERCDVFGTAKARSSAI